MFRQINEELDDKSDTPALGPAASSSGSSGAAPAGRAASFGARSTPSHARPPSTTSSDKSRRTSAAAAATTAATAAADPTADESMETVAEEPAAFPNQHYHVHEYKRRPVRRESTFSAALEEAKQRAEQKRADDIDIQEQLQDLAGYDDGKDPELARDAQILLTAYRLGRDLAAKVARPISDALIMGGIKKRVNELVAQLPRAAEATTATRPHVSTGGSGSRRRRERRERRGRREVPDPSEATAPGPEMDEDENKHDADVVIGHDDNDEPPPPPPPTDPHPDDLPARRENVRALFGPGSNRFRGPTAATVSRLLPVAAPATALNERHNAMYEGAYRRIADAQVIAPASQFRTAVDVNHDEYIRTIFQWTIDARFLAAFSYVLACIRSGPNRITSRLTIQELLQPPFRDFLLEWTAAQFQITMGRSQVPWPNENALLLLCRTTKDMQRYFDNFAPRQS